MKLTGVCCLGMDDLVKWMIGTIIVVPVIHTILECNRGRQAKLRIARWWMSCIFIVLVSFFFAFVCGIGGYFIAHFSVSKPLPVSTQCTILTNSVDLRSTKVCQMGLLNFNSKNVLLSTGNSRYRCYYDYYWASVFKVEYKPHALSQTIHAAAEAPQEALPVECRPNFSSAWKIKDKFKVNETYHCKYTPGKSKVDIVGDNFFSCSAKEVSLFELISRVSILFWRSDRFISSKRSTTMHLMWSIAALIFSGMSCSILLTVLVKTAKVLRFRLLGGHEPKKVDDVFFEVRVQLFCYSIASLFFVIWIEGQREELFSVYRFLSELV